MNGCFKLHATTHRLKRRSGGRGQRFQRSAERTDIRAGSYERHLETKTRTVKLKILELCKLPFESSIIERYKRRECSVKEALMGMYLAGVSVRRFEDITQALWRTRVSAGKVSRLNQQIYQKIDEWRNWQLEESGA
jgi:transposase-like protein